MASRLTDAGTCRYCALPLEHRTLLDDNDQPIDWYLSRGVNAVLDSHCYADTAPERDCDMCDGTGDELGDPNAEWDCDSCDGTGRVADHQPA